MNKELFDRTSRKIWADFDQQGVFIYQAFNSRIANQALSKGTFGDEFSLFRMTWIKPSLGWMLYRSHFATRPNQERILKIKVSHQGFHSMLSQGIPTSFDPFLFAVEADWREALHHSDVRYQWDPDRDFSLRKLDRRALQVGISGTVLKEYVNQHIKEITDTTELAHTIKSVVALNQLAIPFANAEREYQIDLDLQWTLGMVNLPNHQN